MSDKAPDATDLTIATKIRDIRKRKKLTAKDIAAAIGVSFQMYCDYEAGKNRMTVGRFVAISKALDVSPSALLKGF